MVPKLPRNMRRQTANMYDEDADWGGLHNTVSMSLA